MSVFKFANVIWETIMMTANLSQVVQVIAFLSTISNNFGSFFSICRQTCSFKRHCSINMCKPKFSDFRHPYSFLHLLDIFESILIVFWFFFYWFIFQMHQWFLSCKNKNSSNFWRGPYYRTGHLLPKTGKCQWTKFSSQSCAKKLEWGRYCCQLWAKVAIRSAQMGRKLLRVSLQTRT